MPEGVDLEFRRLAPHVPLDFSGLYNIMLIFQLLHHGGNGSPAQGGDRLQLPLGDRTVFVNGVIQGFQVVLAYG